MEDCSLTQDERLTLYTKCRTFLMTWMPGQLLATTQRVLVIQLRISYSPYTLRQKMRISGYSIAYSRILLTIHIIGMLNLGISLLDEKVIADLHGLPLWLFWLHHIVALNASDLKELLHALANKNDGCYNSVFSDSKNAAFENSQSKHNHPILRILLTLSISYKTKIGQDTILVSMDNSSLYTNTPQEEGITV